MKEKQSHSFWAKISGVNKSLWFIIIAALLLEIISAVQYNATHNLLEDQLEKNAEMGLTMKAIVIKNTLNATEKTLKDHTWDMKRNLDYPDSLFEVAEWLVKMNPNIIGGGMAFKPYFFPQKGRLFEPYAKQDKDSVIVVSQIAGENHDYTKREFYLRAMETNKPVWADPYEDKEGAGAMVTTFSMPIHLNGESVGVFSVDLDIEWLGDTLNARHSDPSSFSLLMTEDGDLISKPNSSHHKSYDVKQVVQAINDSTVQRTLSGTCHTKIIYLKSKKDGADMTVFYAPMKGNPHWQIAIVYYDDEVYAPLYRLRLDMLLLTLFAFSILGLIVYFFARSAKKLGMAKVKQERISSELRIASDIQQTMLPAPNEEIADRNDVTVCGILVPAKEVGGDLYSYFIRDEKLFFCIGDVSGKGVPSALIMSVIQALFRNSAAHDSNPGHIMSTLNGLACRNNTTNMFVTLFIGVLDLPTGKLRYCNAGHDAPILLKNEQNIEVKANLPIGIFDDVVYHQQEMQLKRNTTIFLYTDGLTEARNTERKLFGLNRVNEVLEMNEMLPPDELLSTMREAVVKFTGETEQSDDLTMLAISYTPYERNAVLDKEISITNNVSQVKDLNIFVASVTDELKMQDKLAKSIKLAVEEAVVNVISYAYPVGTNGDISVRAIYDGNILDFIITDKGKAFDPTIIDKADTSLEAEERPIGGLGIFLVREMMDSVNYERVKGKNILTLRKQYKIIENENII